MTTLIRQMVISGIWLGFSGYIVWLAPLDQPETFPIVRHLLTLHWSAVNGYLVANGSATDDLRLPDVYRWQNFS